jgi:plastocyanin
MPRLSRLPRLVAFGSWRAFAFILLGGAAACASSQVLVEVRNARGSPVPDVAVWAVPLDGKLPAGGTPRARIDQRARTFIPYVSVVQTGTAIEFPNNDTVRHHVYSFSPAKVFSLKLYLGTPAEPVVFDKPAEVVLGCNIHDHMLAYVYVVDTPHAGVSGADGRVLLEGLAGGSWTISVRQPGMPDPVSRRVLIDAAGRAPVQGFTLDSLPAHRSPKQ